MKLWFSTKFSDNKSKKLLNFGTLEEFENVFITSFA